MMRSSKRSKKGSAIAEFGPSLWIFFILIVIPLVDLASLMWGIGTCMIIANLSVRQAAGARTYTEAINIVNKTEDDLSNFKAFAVVTPTGGGPRGVKLQVISNPIAGAAGTPTIYTPPPAPNRIPVDRATLEANLYHYQVICSYDVSPLMNFNGMPFFSGVPGLGAPVPVTYDGTASVEHPEGLND